MSDITEVTSRDRLPVTAAILAGGRSRRMGVDKTFLEIDGVSMLMRTISAVHNVCANTMVVTTRPKAAAGSGLPDDVTIVTDEVEFQGPLGAIATAMANTEDPWILAIAVDMPWVVPGVVEKLWEYTDGVDVVVPVSEKGMEPLLALYRAEAAQPIARKVLGRGDRRLVHMIRELRVAEVPVEELRGVDPELKSLININTPQDLDAADRKDDESIGTSRDSSGVRLHVIEQDSQPMSGMPSERPITLHMNGMEIATVQASPHDLEEFAAGFLVAEGLLSDLEQLTGIEIDDHRGTIFVTTTEEIPEGVQYRKRYVTSGCGRGLTLSSAANLEGIQSVETDLHIDSDTIYAMASQMTRDAEMYRTTGGMHSCALARDGKVVLLREDVGRHSALDKLLGRAWLDSIPTDDAVLLTSGRISSEMVVKAARSCIPIVVSRTAVTDLAAEVALELGLTIIGYARGKKLVVYTNPWRITDSKED